MKRSILDLAKEHYRGYKEINRTLDAAKYEKCRRIPADRYDESSPNFGWGATFSTNLHPNPRWYKYYWWVFDETCLRIADWQKTQRLCTAEAQAKIDQMQREGKLVFVENSRRARAEPNSPLELSHPKWANYDFAPSFDEDPDPLHDGFK